MFYTHEHAEEVYAHILHEILSALVFEVAAGRYAGVGEHDVEAAVSFEGFLAEGGDIGFGGRVEGLCVDFGSGVEGV